MANPVLPSLANPVLPSLCRSVSSWTHPLAIGFPTCLSQVMKIGLEPELGLMSSPPKQRDPQAQLKEPTWALTSLFCIASHNVRFLKWRATIGLDIIAHDDREAGGCQSMSDTVPTPDPFRPHFHSFSTLHISFHFLMGCFLYTHPNFSFSPDSLVLIGTVQNNSPKLVTGNVIQDPQWRPKTGSATKLWRDGALLLYLETYDRY